MLSAAFTFGSSVVVGSETTFSTSSFGELKVCLVSSADKVCSGAGTAVAFPLFRFNASRSIFPTGLNFGRTSSGTKVWVVCSADESLACDSSAKRAFRFRSFPCRCWIIFSDFIFKSLSLLNSFTSAAYCSSVIFAFGLASIE